MPDFRLWGERELVKLRQDMDRMFEAFCCDLGLAPPGPGLGRIRIDREKGSVVVRIFLPGLKPEEIRLSATKNILLVSGGLDESGRGISSQSSFTDRILLPCRVDPERTQAVYKKQVLTVTLPMLPETGRKRVAISD